MADYKHVKGNYKLNPVLELISKTGGEFTIKDISERTGVSVFTVGRAVKIAMEQGVITHISGDRPKIYQNKNPSTSVITPILSPSEQANPNKPAKVTSFPIKGLTTVPVEPVEPVELVKSVKPVKPVQLIPVVEQFEMIEHITGMVLDGIAPSFLLTGMAGVGKTYTVRQEILARGLQKDVDYRWVSGMASPLGLFRVLHDNRDGVVVFDDCDAVLQVKNSLSILKSALDLYKTRVISWPSKTVSDAGMDEHFEFTGQVIFISNLDFAKIADALTSRAFKVDVFLTPEQVIEKINMIIGDITPNGVTMSMEYKQDALDAMNALKDDIIAMGKNIDLRAFEKACLIRQSVGDSGRWHSVKKMILHQI